MRFSTYSAKGFTLIETTIAAAVAALFLSSVFTMNVACIDTIRCAKESVLASEVLQQRVESMRIANWQEITDADWVSAHLLNENLPGSDQLRDLSETLTVVPYGSASVGNTQLVRTGNVTTIVNRSSALLTENAIKVIWTVDYTGAPNNRATSRQIVAILAQGGVAK